MGSKHLRLSSAVILAGVLVSIISGLLHPGSVPANEHQAVFAEYSASSAWISVHLGQFVGMVLLTVGLIMLTPEVSATDGVTGALNRLCSSILAAALTLYGVLQAVDGVALKQAVNALVAAPEAEKASRFAVAEGIRWLEWGVRSYHSFVFGLALLLLAAALNRARVVSWPLPVLIGSTGICYWVQGWIIGTVGFAPTNSLPTLVGIATILTWSLWLLVNGQL